MLAGRFPLELKNCISNAKFKQSEIIGIFFLMEGTRRTNLHKSLKLFLKEYEKALWLFIDFKLKSVR